MYGVLANLLLGMGVLFIYLFCYSYFKRKNSLSTLFAFICLAIAVYIIGYGLELKSTSLREIQFFIKMEYFGISILPILWIVLGYRFCFNKYPPMELNFLVGVFPVISLFIINTNEYHHLYYRSIWAVRRGEYLLVEFVKGPWYGLFVVYAYFSIVIGIFLLFRGASKNIDRKRKQVMWMSLGCAGPCIGNVLYLLGITPPNLDTTPFGFIILAICLFIAVFHYGFLDRKEAVRRYIVDQVKEGILVVDNKSRILDFNKSAKKVFPELSNDYIGAQVGTIRYGEMIDKRCENEFELEIVVDDEIGYYEFKRTELKEGKQIVGDIYIFQDITSKKKVIEKLNYLASYDMLTQIYNRTKLMAEAEKLFKIKQVDKEPITVLMIDIDFFKHVNDTYGHLVGDKTIKGIVKTCKHLVPKGDIIGRYGGEEFLVLVSVKTYEESLALAEKMREEVEKDKIYTEIGEITVTISIGGIFSPIITDNMTLQDLIRIGDKALYEAKNNGRNQVRMKT